MKNKITYNFFVLGAVQVISSLLQLLVIPYVISIIGADGFGIVAVAQVVMFYLSVFTDYGFNQTATREIALYRYDRERISRIFFRIVFSRLILCAVAFILLLILVSVIPLFRSHYLLYLMGFVFVAGQSALVTWFFQGLERMQFIAFATLIARLLFVLLVFLFIKSKGDGYLFLFFLGVGNLLAGIVSIAVACRIFKLEFIKPSRKDITAELKEGWHIAATNLSNNTCLYANIFILRFFTNDLVVGYYSIAERIYFTMRQVLGVFSQSIYPRVCQLVQEGKEQVIFFFRRVYVPFLLLIISGAILLIIFSPQVLSFFIGKNNISSVPLLRGFSIVLVIACLNIPFTLVLLALNRKKSYFSIYTLATVLNIISNILLVHFFKAAGTVTAILLTELFITAGLFREVYHYYRITGKGTGHIDV